MPYWIERMTTAYLRAEGGKVDKHLFAYDLQWPDGERMENVCFVGREAQDRDLHHVSLEHPKLQCLLAQLPRAVPGEPILTISMPELAVQIHDYWSLWYVALRHGHSREARVLPLFSQDDGRILLPTARSIWDKLLQEGTTIQQRGTVGSTTSHDVFAHLRQAAEQHGESLFQQLSTQHHDRLRQARAKGCYAFEVRRQALQRIGLPEVRQFRLRRLDEEARAWEADMCRQEHIIPKLQPIVVLRVESGNG